MKTLFLVIPRRISVRYVLSSDIFPLLKEKGDLRIVILTSINDPEFIKEFSAENVFIEYIPMRDGKENFIERGLRIFRNYLGNALNDFSTFDIKIRKKGRFLHSLYRLFVKIAPAFSFLKKLAAWLDLNLISPILDKYYEVLFQKYSPDLVVIHSVFELTATPVARVAKRKKVPSIGIVLSWDNLTNKGEIYARCEKLIVWNNIMREEAIKYYDYKEKDVIVTGTPQFDFYVKYADSLLNREDFFKKMGLDIGKKLIVYTTTPARIGHLDPEVIEFIANAIKENQFINPCQLLVRIYTKDNPKRYERFRDNKDIILDYWPENLPEGLNYKETDKYVMLHLANTMKNAALIINVVSTTSIDASIFDTPVINPAFGKLKFWYEITHYRNLVATRGVRVVYAEKELIDLINFYLKNPEADREQRKEIVNKFCWKMDGLAGKRISDFIISSLL